MNEIALLSGLENGSQAVKFTVVTFNVGLLEIPWGLYQPDGWRIVVPPMIRWDFSFCYDSSMPYLAVLLIHFIAVLARLLGPGGVRSLVAESLLLRHQLLIVNRSRQRSPNLSS